MAIEFRCACGRALRAADSSAGKHGRCPGCGEIFTVPQAASAAAPFVTAAVDETLDQEESDAGPIPVAPPRNAPNSFGAFEVDPYARNQAARLPSFITRSPTTPSGVPVIRKPIPALPLPQGPTGRKYHYLVLLLALLPLVWSTIHKGTDDDVTLDQRLARTVKLHPEVREKLDSLPDKATVDEVLAVFPDDRLEGALLPRNTYMHWGFALVSGIGFLGAILLLFPPGHTRIYQLALIGAFTGTAGILLLLGFQWLAFNMGGFVVPRGIVGLLFDLVWLIGQSYRLALTETNFLLSFLGFTFGVGFCEEVCKAIPLVFKARGSGYYSWRSAMLWGLVSGVGFGVSEGITYSTDYYNGIHGGGIYLVRFVSCVGLHAIWAAAVGITIFRRQDFFRGEMHVLEWIWRLGQVVIVPMVLHGLYDTLLKKEHPGFALVTSLVSFGWLAWQIELAKRQFDEPEAALAV